MPGAGTSCKLYDKTVFLTNHDIKEIIKKINERRNYVAMGYSKFLPAAANMREIVSVVFYAHLFIDKNVYFKMRFQEISDIKLSHFSYCKEEYNAN